MGFERREAMLSEVVGEQEARKLTRTASLQRIPSKTLQDASVRVAGGRKSGVVHLRMNMLKSAYKSNPALNGVAFFLLLRCALALDLKGRYGCVGLKTHYHLGSPPEIVEESHSLGSSRVDYKHSVESKEDDVIQSLKSPPKGDEEMMVKVLGELPDMCVAYCEINIQNNPHQSVQMSIRDAFMQSLLASESPVRKQFISLIPYFASGDARKRTSDERPFRGVLFTEAGKDTRATSRSDPSPLPLIFGSAI
ncbi:hypothetical protein CDAR_406051 [Caerostris darwini]|uniref:Uncharacterized protein n=1 Tax=Caerostris darwini TaxID=1538125 RepID=A0AAV4TUV2_9ARAC|nr:hypothetical protein CDAR_406051 [Caerostris darwini]